MTKNLQALSPVSIQTDQWNDTQEKNTKFQSQGEIFKQHGSLTWYNQEYINIEPVIMTFDSYNNYQDLTNQLFEKISLENRPSLWDQLNANQRMSRIEAFYRVFLHKDRYNWQNQLSPSNCYGWKVIETNRYQELIETVDIYSKKISPIDNFFEKGDVTIVNQENLSITPFYIPPKRYSRPREVYLKEYKNKPHSDLMEISIILYRQLHPNIEINSKRKESIYKRTYKLFTDQVDSYNGYVVLLGKHEGNIDVMSKTLNKMFLGSIHDYKVIDFFVDNNLDSILKIVTDFYEKTFPHLLPAWLDFFKTNFSTTTKIKELSEKVKNSEISEFPTEFKQAENYLANSPSVYHKVCYFFWLNPISDDKFKEKAITKLENHHIIPHALSNIYEQIKPNIDKNFNLIRITWIIHYFLHILRWLEFKSLNDYKALKVMRNYALNLLNEQNVSEEEESTNCYQFIFDSFQEIKIWIEKQSAKDKLDSDQVSRNRFINQQNPKIRDLYQQDMVWKNKDYPNFPEIPIPGGTIQLNTDLIPVFKNKLKAFLKDHSQFKKPKNWDTAKDENLSHYIGAHLRFKLKITEKPAATAFWGFYLDLNES